MVASTHRPNFGQSEQSSAPVFTPAFRPAMENTFGGADAPAGLGLFRPANDVNQFKFDRQSFDKSRESVRYCDIKKLEEKMQNFLLDTKRAIASGNAFSADKAVLSLIGAYRDCEARLKGSPNLSLEAKTAALAIKSTAMGMAELKGRALDPMLKAEMKNCTSVGMKAIEDKKADVEYRRNSQNNPMSGMGMH